MQRIRVTRQDVRSLEPFPFLLQFPARNDHALTLPIGVLAATTAIALPTQNPLLRSLKADLAEGDPSTSDLTPTIPVSRRGLTISEVLVHLHHHNASVKKDALIELKDVLVNGVELGVGMGKREGEVGRVMRGVLGLISNEEATVRKSLLSFLGWYLALLPSDTLAPYMNELLLQASMGLSHIYHDIRVDSCRLVQLLLHHASSHVVGSWPANASSANTHAHAHAHVNGNSSSGGGATSGQSNENRILDGLRLVAGIGGRAGEGGQNGLNLLAGSKLVILDTLLVFVRAGLGKQGFIKGDDALTSSAAGTEKGKGKGGRASAAKDLQFPEEIFTAFESRYPTTNRISSTSGKGKPRQPPSLPITKLSDAAFAEQGALFDGWLVSPWMEAGMDLEGGGGWDLAGVGARFVEGVEGGGDQVGQALAELYLHMHPLFIATLMESAPAAFSLSSLSSTTTLLQPDVNLSLCRTIMHLVSVLGGQVLGRYRSMPGPLVGEVRKSVGSIVQRMAAYFPFGGLASGAERIGPAVQEMYEHLNLFFSQTVLLLPPAPGRLPPRAKTSNPNALVQQMSKEFERVERARTEKDVDHLRRVADWLVELLSSNVDVLQPALSPHSYLSVLPLIWSLISGSSLIAEGEEGSIAADVCESFLEHLLRTGSDSVTRRLGNEFVVRMVMIHESPYPVLPFFIPANSTAQRLLQRWLESLPRVIWELDNKDSRATQLVLDFLLWVQQRDTKLFDQTSLNNVAARLHPFFHLQHPSRGAITGPWARLESSALRMLAVDVAYVWGQRGNEKLDEAVGKAVQQAGYEVERARWESLLRVL
ncbi:hypothetical protein QFC22_003632 [Naganishia vaughanmartiniae]|uniref:Uncharacterized protein n=1 Tax=Naganishia vaughanmartiniae TaxID=1424756 RepID=A0ACC2X7V1_9TREE|nr:hypothetical protein QFC22_003632 [Naganishia vaughanmartiniae]